MLNALRSYYQSSPLASILWLGMIFRMVAVIFSKGYGMHDDHFLVIEAAQSWVDGFDYNHWLPGKVNQEPTGHSFFYVGLHYLFFLFFEYLGLNDPETKMYFVRLFHALWSMVGVYFGYKITEKLSTSENARIVGMLLALFWFYPILSVRTMVEMVCIPFLLLSFWYLIKSDKRRLTHFAIAGIFMGLSIGVRIQTYLIWGGIGLVLLFRKEIMGAIVFGITSIAALFLTQVSDLFIWGSPFAEMTQYIFYNTSHYEDYITQAWYQYLILLAGLLIPPVSLFLLFGYFRTWKKMALIFIPVLIFLIFHSLYPNKQERFILPVIPLIIICGVIGWREYMKGSEFWKKRTALYQFSIRFFWVLNTLALLFITPASSKKSRIDTMSYLRNLEDVRGLFLERTTSYGCYLMPRYYHGDWKIKHLCYSKNEISKYKDKDMKDFLFRSDVNYCLFIENKELENRISVMKENFPEMKFIKEIQPSYMDKLLHFLNPVNSNESIYIYRLY